MSETHERNAARFIRDIEAKFRETFPSANNVRATFSANDEVWYCEVDDLTYVAEIASDDDGNLYFYDCHDELVVTVGFPADYEEE